MTETPRQTSAHTAIWLFLALAAIELWGDAKGSLPALAALNDALSASIANGRLFGLVGLLSYSLASTLRPDALARIKGPGVMAGTCVGACASAVVSLLCASQPYDSALHIGCLLVMGATYGLVVIDALRRLSIECLSPAKLASGIAAVLAAKTALLPLLGMTPEVAQAAALPLLPLGAGAALLRASCPSRRQCSAPEQSFFPIDRVTFLGLFALAVALNVSVRAFSVFGSWGTPGSLSADDLAPALAAAVLLIVAVAALFPHIGSTRAFSDSLIGALAISLAGFFLLHSGALPEPPAAEGAPASFETFLEMLTGASYWICLVLIGGLKPNRAFEAIARGQCARNALAVAFCVLLELLPGMQQSAFPVVATAIALGLFALLGRLLSRPEVDAALDQAAPDKAALDQTAPDRAAPDRADGDLPSTCAAFAEAHKLTARETEVLVLIAQGRSQAFIAGELVLAESTVKSHVRHIYQKCDVSRKQDLITKLQDFARTN